MKNILETKAGMRVLIHLNNGKTYLQKISWKLNITYAHVSKIISNLENWKLIKCKKQGRIKYVELTDKGKKVANSLIKIQEGK